MPTSTASFAVRGQRSLLRQIREALASGGPVQARLDMVVRIIAVLTASLSGLARVEGFQAYDCSNASNPVDMYSLLDPEHCSNL